MHSPHKYYANYLVPEQSVVVKCSHQKEVVGALRLINPYAPTLSQLGVVVRLLLILLLLAQCCTKDVTQAGTAVGRTEVGHGLFLILDLKSLDRQCPGVGCCYRCS